MNEYKKTAIIVVITLVITTAFNYLLQYGTNFWKDSPSVEISTRSTKLPIAIALSIISKEQTDAAKEIIELFEKYKPENEYFGEGRISDLKNFLNNRKSIAGTPSEKIVDQLRKNASLDYSVIRISNETDALLSDITVIVPTDDNIFDTNTSSSKDYNLTLNGNKAELTSLPPGTEVFLFTTAKKYRTIQSIKILHEARIVNPIDLSVPAYGFLSWIVSLSNSGFFFEFIVSIIFFMGTTAVIVMIAAPFVQMLSTHLKKASHT